ncbi:MAG: glycosyl transferase family 1 [Pedosphaera sp.]|nr:glycosyl transferase family 1 [Pedosphaera sp.]
MAGMLEPRPVMGPTKLILVTHEFAPFRGGVATYVAEIGAAIQRAGGTVEIWAPGYGLGNVEEESSCPVVRLRAGGSLKPGHLLQLTRALASRREELERSTVVLASVGAHIAFMMLVATGRAPRGRIISVLYGSEVLRFGRNPAWRWLARRLFRQVGIIVTISEFSKSLIGKSFLSSSAAKVAIAPCGCSSAAAQTVAAKGAQDGRLRIFTLARIHPRKGQLDTARALGGLPEELRARIIYQLGGTGDADYLREVEQACRKAGVAFEHLGAIPPGALAVAYVQCDIFAMTSRQLPRSVEGFGIACLDAGWHGKPVIAYRSGGASEAVLDGETGLLVEEGNLTALTTAFARLISDAALRERLGAGGRKRAEPCGWDEAADLFLKFKV